MSLVLNCYFCCPHDHYQLKIGWHYLLIPDRLLHHCNCIILNRKTRDHINLWFGQHNLLFHDNGLPLCYLWNHYDHLFQICLHIRLYRFFVQIQNCDLYCGSCFDLRRLLRRVCSHYSHQLLSFRPQSVRLYWWYFKNVELNEFRLRLPNLPISFKRCFDSMFDLFIAFIIDAYYGTPQNIKSRHPESFSVLV